MLLRTLCSPATGGRPSLTSCGLDDQTGLGGRRSEREAEGGKQGVALGIGVGGGADGDVHAPDGVDLVVVDLGEDQLLGDTERVVAAAIERSRREAPEVADTRDGDADEAIEELPHPVAAQRDLGPDGIALPELE